MVKLPKLYDKYVFTCLTRTTTYIPAGVHRHFVLFGLTEYLRRRLVCTSTLLHYWFTHTFSVIFFIVDALAMCCHSLNRRFSPSQVLQLLDRFYNLDMLVCTCHIYKTNPSLGIPVSVNSFERHMCICFLHFIYNVLERNLFFFILVVQKVNICSYTCFLLQ